MNTGKLSKIYILLLLIAAITMYGLWSIMKKKEYVPRDYVAINKEGILRVVTEYNSVGYYVSGDTIQGFQYELCKAIEAQSGLTVEIYLENDLESSIKGLENQEYDIIARNIPITTKNKNIFLFTEPIFLNKQVLVQRTSKFNDGKEPIRNQIDLAKKTLYVPKNSPSILRLNHLAEEIADTIYIKEDEHYESEQLIYMVANGDIDYAVVDRQIALSNQTNFPQLDIQTDISFTQLQAWAIRKDAPVLLDSLNNWLNQIKSTKLFDKLSKKYL